VSEADTHLPRFWQNEHLNGSALWRATSLPAVGHALSGVFLKAFTSLLSVTVLSCIFTCHYRVFLDLDMIVQYRSYCAIIIVCLLHAR
jgi:hypothetical protein